MTDRLEEAFRRIEALERRLGPIPQGDGDLGGSEAPEPAGDSSPASPEKWHPVGVVGRGRTLRPVWAGLGVRGWDAWYPHDAPHEDIIRVSEAEAKLAERDAEIERLKEEIERLNARLDGGVEGSTYIEADPYVVKGKLAETPYRDLYVGGTWLRIISSYYPPDWPIGTRVRVIREEGE